MAKFIGRRVSLGVAKETTRGTFVAPAFYIPQMSLEMDEVVETIEDESAIGRIEDINGIDIVEKKSKGVLEGRITDKVFGLFILAMTGTEATPALVETGVYDHVFTVNNINQPTTLSFAVSEPNATTTASLRYTLSVIEQLEIMVEMRKYAMFKASILANVMVAGSATPSYTAENYFTPVHASVKIASAQSGLGAASALTVRKLSLSMNRNIEEDYNLGSLNATDRLNKQLSIDGVLELVYDDRTYIDTIMLGDLAKALRLKLTNSAITLGASSRPDIQIDLYAVKIKEVARKLDNNGIVLQTISFKAYYSQADSAMVAVTIRNTQSAAY